MLKSLTGATLVVNDAGIFIQNGKGAVDHDDGATSSTSISAR